MRVLGAILILIVVFLNLLERFNIEQKRIRVFLAILWGVIVFIVMYISPCGIYGEECLKISNLVNLIGSLGSALLMYFYLVILDFFDDGIIKYIIFAISGYLFLLYFIVFFYLYFL